MSFVFPFHACAREQHCCDHPAVVKVQGSTWIGFHIHPFLLIQKLTHQGTPFHELPPTPF